MPCRCRGGIRAGAARNVAACRRGRLTLIAAQGTCCPSGAWLHDRHGQHSGVQAHQGFGQRKLVAARLTNNPTALRPEGLSALIWTQCSSSATLLRQRNFGNTSTHVPHRTRRHRLRHPSRGAQPARPPSLPFGPLARRRHPARRARARVDRLPGQFAADLPSRLAAAQRQARLRPRRAARPRARPRSAPASRSATASTACSCCSPRTWAPASPAR